MSIGEGPEGQEEPGPKTGWYCWHGPRLRALPIILVAAMGFVIVAASFVAGRFILLHLNARLLPRMWPLLVIAELFELCFALAGISVARRWLPSADFRLRWPSGNAMIGKAVAWGALFGAIMLVVDHGANLVHGLAPVAPGHTAVDVAGWLAFELFQVGLCEEMLFRGLLLGVLEALSPSRVQFGKFQISTAGITIAVIFALAHAGNFATDPWPVALGQQLYAVALGIVYAWLRERSGSLAAPIVAHSVSDFSETAAVCLLTMLLPHAPGA